MQITNVVWANEEQSEVKVTTSDMGTFNVKYYETYNPNETWHMAVLREWVAVPNEIGAYVDSTDYMALMRGERDPLLMACDWTQLPDSPLSASLKADWAAYRQDLRDMPQDNPITTKAEYDALVWPVEPA